jgi:hypothetical protein
VSNAMIPETSRRVPQNTEAFINRRIRNETEDRVASYHHASPGQIEARLSELEQEWDTERVLEANAASVAFAGCVLAATADQRWIVVPLAVTAFLFQHAVQGWCPPLPVIRRLGFRTQREIDEERFALKALRGDFRPVSEPTRQMEPSPRQVLESVQQ